MLLPLAGHDPVDVVDTVDGSDHPHEGLEVGGVGDLEAFAS